MMLFQFGLILGDSVTSPEFVSQLFFNFLKVMFVVAGLLFVAFSIIVVRQIHTMQESLVTSLTGVMRLLGILQLIASLLALAYFVLVL